MLANPGNGSAGLMASYKYNSVDEDKFDEEYFARTYRPLSNLPTPPPSSRNSSAVQSPIAGLDDGKYLDPNLLGKFSAISVWCLLYAKSIYKGASIHLVNLLPPSASLVTPSVALVHTILDRARLPQDIIALAVCIMDTLDSKFSLNWRLTCPLRCESLLGSSKRHTIPAGTVSIEQLHIDSVNPEVIILSSLMIAFKFLEDCNEPTRYYASEWGRGVWSCEQINATERCIMNRLEYRILPLWDKDLIDYALEDMRRAGKQAEQQIIKASSYETARPSSSPMSSGQAVVGLGLQLTPADTPTEEVPYSLLLSPVIHTADVFTMASTKVQESLYIPRRKTVASRLEGLIDGMTHP